MIIDLRTPFSTRRDQLFTYFRSLTLFLYTKKQPSFQLCLQTCLRLLGCLAYAHPKRVESRQHIASRFFQSSMQKCPISGKQQTTQCIDVMQGNGR